jgi:hypothetical protein
MKASMTCLPMLMVPNSEIEFHVHINASNFALGVMLSQNLDNTIDIPIYYASKWIMQKIFIRQLKKNFGNDVCCEKIQILFVGK